MNFKVMLRGLINLNQAIFHTKNACACWSLDFKISSVLLNTPTSACSSDNYVILNDKKQAFKKVSQIKTTQTNT